MNKKVDRRGKPREAGKFRRLLFTSLVISFLGAFLVLWIWNGDSPYASLRYLVTSNVPEVVYETYTISLGSSLPDNYVVQIKESLGGIEYNGVKRFEFVNEDADIAISLSSDSDGYILKEDLIPVSHLYSVRKDVDFDNLKDEKIFILDSTYEEYIEELLGVDVDVLEDREEMVAVLKTADHHIGLVMLKDIVPELKILFLNDEYYLDNQEACISIYFNAESKESVSGYMLSVVHRNIVLDLEVEELHGDNLAKVNMTGVTAISRNLARKVDASGDYEYPAEYLGEFLADADLTHTSNEVSFVEGCAVYSGMRFCSNPEYMAALLKSGIDIVELTGNHNNDFGSTYSAKSIEMYVNAGMRYFGGGLNADDASKILYELVEGNVVAFLGYNYYDTMLGTGAIAGEARSGANSYSVTKMEEDISEAKRNSDIVIVDFQFQECWSYPSSNVIFPPCYKPLSSPDQKGVFRSAIDFGADIVVGTQAHQPQTFEVYGEGVIFYGLGNLYFDQNNWIGTRQGMVLTHYFYEGKHIQTKVTPIFMNDNLQPELATEAQGDLLMELLMEAR